MPPAGGRAHAVDGRIRISVPIRVYTIYNALSKRATLQVAVRTLSMGVAHGECFGMLGPNGAGKTTTINMLIGFTPPSAGTATVEGLDVRTSMDRIYSLMGVCPQHDVLWETLTAREHLRFYGRLKNLRGKARPPLPVHM